MADIRNHAINGSFTAEQSIPAGTTRLLVWAVDAIPTATATKAVWLRLTNPDGDVAETLIADGTRLELNISGPDRARGNGVAGLWTYALKALAAGPFVGVVVLT